MSYPPPEAGDIVVVDFDPARGTEQQGTRPALVISATLFNASGHRSIVCPVTRNAQEWPTKVKLPDGCGATGYVLADQVRSVDRLSRGFRKIGHAPPETVDAVRRKIIGLFSDKPVV